MPDRSKSEGRNESAEELKTRAPNLECLPYNHEGTNRGWVGVIWYSVKKPFRPKHSSSDGSALDSRPRGPGFESRWIL